MHDIDDLRLLRQQALDAPPASEQARARAWARLTQAMDTEAGSAPPPANVPCAGACGGWRPPPALPQ